MELDVNEEKEEVELKLDEILINEIDFDSFEFSEIVDEPQVKTEQLNTKVVKKRGRPSKQSLPTEKINNQKLTITLTQDEKNELNIQAQATGRTVSNFIKWVLKETKSIKKDILSSSDGKTKEKKVSITIAINQIDKSQLEQYSKKVNRKIADLVKYVLKNTSKIKENILE